MYCWSLAWRILSITLLHVRWVQVFGLALSLSSAMFKAFSFHSFFLFVFVFFVVVCLFLGCILVVCYIWCAVFLLRVFIFISIVDLTSLFLSLLLFFFAYWSILVYWLYTKKWEAAFLFPWPDKYIECVTYRVILDCLACSTFSLSAVFLLCLWNM